jgi:hypothetical protein
MAKSTLVSNDHVGASVNVFKQQSAHELKIEWCIAGVLEKNMQYSTKLPN